MSVVECEIDKLLDYAVHKDSVSPADETIGLQRTDFYPQFATKYFGALDDFDASLFGSVCSTIVYIYIKFDRFSLSYFLMLSLSSQAS